MALSEYEQEMLAQLEEQLRDEDPKLAQSFQPARQVSLKRLVIGLFIVVAGLGILVAAVAFSMSWLGIIAFAVMLGGALYIFSGPRGLSSAPPAPTNSRRGPSRESFMARQQDMWERRREQDGR